LWIVDPLEPIYPDRNDEESLDRRWRTATPLGALTDAHILFRSPVGTDFEIEARLNGDLIPLQRLYKLIDVPVEENTGIDSRTEQFLNKINPYVIRRAPFRVFEVISPVSSSTFTSQTPYSAFRLQLDAGYLKSPGNYKVSIVVKTDEKKYKGIWSFRVIKAQQPDPGLSNFFYTNWFNLRRMEENHQVDRWTEAWFAMLDKYAALMAHGRQNSITIPHELLRYEEGEFLLDEDKMYRFIKVFQNHDFRYFEAPHLLNRGEEDDWGDPELKVALTKRRYYTENGRADIEKIMLLVKAFTDNYELNANWLQHIADEPTAVNAQCYKDVSAQIKRIYPEVKIMEATNARDQLSGSIDIWCPIIDDFQENESFFRSREELGERVLVYTCLVPGGPWLNRTLDMERVRQVYFGWGAARFNTGGYLHWGLNQYYADPYEQSVIKHPSPVASDNNFLPAGDTHIIYPGKYGPLSSVRFEAHRLGIEDYDLLQLLKESQYTKYESLVNSVFRSYTDYSKDTRRYRKTRKKLLKLLKD
jgi:hypothetical protein